MRFRDSFEFWVDRAIGVGPFGYDPGFEQLRCAYFRSKRAKREVYELDPPPLGTSAENPGTLDLSLSHRRITFVGAQFVDVLLLSSVR